VIFEECNGLHDLREGVYRIEFTQEDEQSPYEEGEVELGLVYALQ
jgi:hypothetical protein